MFRILQVIFGEKSLEEVPQPQESKMLQTIETEFNTILSKAIPTMDKLEALVGLHAKASTVAALQPQLTTILTNAALTNEQRIEQILTLTGKL